MPLNHQDPIAPTQSATIRAALGIIVVKVAALLAAVGASAAAIDAFNQYAGLAVEVVTDCLAIYLAFRVIRHRINATETIQKKEK